MTPPLHTAHIRGHRQASRLTIDRILHPRSVAVLGASDNVAKFGGRIMSFLVKHGYAGELLRGSLREQGPERAAVLVRVRGAADVHAHLAPTQPPLPAQRRRALQQEYNREHNITPETIRKSIRAGIESEVSAHAQANAAVGRKDEAQYITEEFLSELEAEMLAAADALEFERAAKLRDRIEKLKASVGQTVADAEVDDDSSSGRGRRRGVRRRPGSGGAGRAALGLKQLHR